jgi:class 3 adenylate cyclase/putative methionine-R-sulfoxide reductase with GAF domain
MIEQQHGPSEGLPMKTPPEGALPDAQGIIADLRSQLAKCTAERDEAVAEQTATAEVLGVINSSSGDLVSVFNAIIDKAMELCGSDFGHVWTYDGEFFYAAALRGAPPTYADLLSGLPVVAPPGTVLGGIVAGNDAFQLTDITAAEGYRSGNPGGLALIELGGARTVVAVPLRKDGRLVGAISAYRQEVRSFTDKETALLQNFAAQAVVAMENARLINETREALEQRTATAEVLQVINSSPGNLAPVFDAMLEKAMRLCEFAFGTLWTCDAGTFRPVAQHGVPANYIDALSGVAVTPHPGAQGTFAQLAKGSDYVHVLDVAAEPAYRVTPAGRALVKLGGARTTLAVALRRDDTLLGVITAYRREVRPFSDKQIAMLQNFAAQAVIAMENARLLTETREALEQQTATAEVLQVINSSPGDLAPVFNTILEKAHSLCGIVHGSLQLYDGERFRAVATHGMPEPLADLLCQPYTPEPGSASRRIVDGEPFYQIPDLAQVVAQSSAPNPRNKLSVELNSARTLLLVPLRKDDALLGLITATRQEVRPFSDKQIALLQNFAAQAVIAIENARLLDELRQRTDEVAALNRDLEARVAEQVEELGRVGRLRRFLAPQLAELIVSQGDENILESHRREIVVVFCDLRGYTAFTETAEPEEVLDFLREYHGALGPLVSQYEGTLDQFSGDGIMVFFNDPVPIPDPAERAVKMAMAMRQAAGTLIADWRERGRDLGFGAGIAQGYATLGQIGFAERSGYTAIGTVCNVAARLCAEAKDGQILLSQRVNVALKGHIATEQVGALALKGLTQPVVAYDVPLVASQAALRVIEGGPQSVLIAAIGTTPPGRSVNDGKGAS